MRSVHSQGSVRRELMLAALTLVLLRPSAGHAQTALSQLADSLPPDTWAPFSTNNINTALTSADFGGGASGVILGYADNGTWDPVSRQIFFSGGDHNWGIPTTVKFVSYSESTNTWEEHPTPTWASGVMHGYDHSTIDEARGVFYHRPYASTAVHRYDIAAQTWDQPAMAANPFVGGYNDYNNCCDALQYFPEMGALLWVAGNGAAGQNNAHVYSYSVATSQWTTLSGSVDLSGTWTLAEYNPVHKLVIFYSAGTGALYKLSSSGQITRLNDPPIPLYNGANGLLTVDPVSGEYLTLSGPSASYGDFHSYNVLTDTWQALSLPTKPDFSNQGVIAAPISTYGVILFAACSSGNPGSCQAYLYKHAATPVDATAPAAPTGLRVQ